VASFQSSGIAAPVNIAGSGKPSFTAKGLELGGNTTFRPGGSPITISGNLTVSSGSKLVMQHSSDAVTISGNATFGGTNSNGQLTEGVLTVRGSFTQTSANSQSSFAASGNHVTRLEPTAANRLVDFSTPDSLATRSHFNHLVISNDSGPGIVSTRLDTSIVAIGQLRTTGTTLARRIINGFGHTLLVGGVDADSLLFDNTRVVIGDLAAVTRFDWMRWQNMLTTSVQLSLVRRGDGPSTYGPFNNLIFENPGGSPPAGFHLLTQLSTPGAWSVLLNGTTPTTGSETVRASQGAGTTIAWSP
jgi:hypothetical protein